MTADADMQRLKPMLWLAAAFLLLGLWLLLDGGTENQWLFHQINLNAHANLPPERQLLWSHGMAFATVLGDTHIMMLIILLSVQRRIFAVGGKLVDISGPQLAPLCITIILAATLSESLKTLFASARPAAVLLADSIHIIGVRLHAKAFPSGHTIAAFACTTVLLPIIASNAMRWGLTLLAIVIGVSRVGVGAHWPIDVAGGAVIGVFSGTVGWLLAGWLARPSTAAAVALPLRRARRLLYQALTLLGLFLLLLNLALTAFYSTDYQIGRLCSLLLAALIIIDVAWRCRKL